MTGFSSWHPLLLHVTCRQCLGGSAPARLQLTSGKLWPRLRLRNSTEFWVWTHVLRLHT